MFIWIRVRLNQTGLLKLTGFFLLSCLKSLQVCYASLDISRPSLIK